MPTIPSNTKLYFCRITAPSNTIEALKLNLFIQTKHYKHNFTSLYYVHETGIKTEKPHYHLLIKCKTTKIEISKWIKQTFTLSGNEQFSVSDKYEETSWEKSLAYMHKGGINEIYDALTQTKLEINEEYSNKLTELFNPNHTKKLKDDTTFTHYMNLMITNYNANTETDLKLKFQQYNYDELLKKIFYVLIKDAIKQRKRIMRTNLYDWSFTLTLHLCSYKEQERLIEKTLEETISKNLNI